MLVVLCLVQALVLNQVHLFGIATPLLYVYFVLLYRRGEPRWALLLWSFLLGVVIDTFSNTPGVAAASMTLMGLLQPYLLAPFIPRDSAEDLQPSMRTLGVTQYIYYTVIVTFLYCLLFFTLEMFTFYNWQEWLATIGSSWLLTVVLILVIENFRSK
jgi:rod shape-determining protein MreD